MNSHKKKPLVSIFCMVYNHESFIRDCLEGFLMQKCNFNYEIILGEDCSTDNSKEIILEYANKFPEKFILLLNNKNIGAVQNQKIVLENCEGKYIAMCEGDDYWIDPYKLQKQVDFLEANSEFVGCVSNGIVKYEKSGEEHLYHNFSSDMIIHPEMALASLVGLTPTVMFRNVLKEKDVRIISRNDYFGGDRMLFALLSRFGAFKYMAKPMCVYRKHEKGITFNKDIIFFSRSEINILNIINKEYGIIFYPTIQKAILLAKIKLVNRLASAKKLSFIFELSKAVTHTRSIPSLKLYLKDGFIDSLRLYFLNNQTKF